MPVDPYNVLVLLTTVGLAFLSLTVLGLASATANAYRKLHRAQEELTQLRRKLAILDAEHRPVSSSQLVEDANPYRPPSLDS